MEKYIRGREEILRKRTIKRKNREQRAKKAIRIKDRVKEEGKR